MYLEKLQDVFRAKCEQGEDKIAFTFLRDDLSVVEALSYRALHEECRALSLQLASLVPFGGRVLLALPPGLDFVRAFWACILSGRVAVPVPAPEASRLLHSGPRLRGIVEDAQAALVLTSESLMDSARTVFEPAMFASARWMSMTELRAVPDSTEPRASGSRDPEPDSGTLAYLQYTSGSTLAPRGVRISHAQALANVHALIAAGRVDTSTRMLTWLPHFHDYGLVCGMLVPFVAGATGYLMSPLTFLRRPLRWLEAVGTLRITHTGAPMSAFAACLRALGDVPLASDLSSLVSLSCGAEPLRAEAVERVLEVFGAAGLRPEAFMPAYGLAEAVLGVTLGADDRPPQLLTLDADALQRDQVVPARDGAAATRLVGSGQLLAHTSVRIVDPASGAPSGVGTVGEIWVCSPSIGDGYWRRPDLSEAGFGVRLPDGSGPYLRTGDLGFLADDG